MSPPAERSWPPAIRRSLALLNVKPGTPEYRTEGLRLSVESCQERRAVTDCRICPQFEFCEVAKEHLTVLRYAARADLLPPVERPAQGAPREEGGSSTSVSTSGTGGSTYWPNPGSSQ